MQSQFMPTTNFSEVDGKSEEFCPADCLDLGQFALKDPNFLQTAEATNLMEFAN